MDKPGTLGAIDSETCPDDPPAEIVLELWPPQDAPIGSEQMLHVAAVIETDSGPYTVGGVTVRAKVGCDGDTDEDGDVDGSDLATVLADPGAHELATFAANFGRNDCLDLVSAQACCLHNGGCMNVLARECVPALGTPQGPGSNCATGPVRDHARGAAANTLLPDVGVMRLASSPEIVAPITTNGAITSRTIPAKGDAAAWPPLDVRVRTAASAEGHFATITGSGVLRPERRILQPGGLGQPYSRGAAPCHV